MEAWDGLAWKGDGVGLGFEQKREKIKRKKEEKWRRKERKRAGKKKGDRDQIRWNKIK